MCQLAYRFILLFAPNSLCIVRSIQAKYISKFPDQREVPAGGEKVKMDLPLTNVSMVPLSLLRVPVLDLCRAELSLAPSQILLGILYQF